MPGKRLSAGASKFHLSGSEAVSRERLAAAARDVFEFAAGAAWSSYDPFDLLLSPYARRLQSVSWFGARVVVQIGKRSGTRLRRLLAVPQHEESTTLADFLRAAAMFASQGEQWAGVYIDELSTRLQARARRDGGAHGWGLDFPYASRFINVERGTPNIYTTTGACQALLDHYELTGAPAALDSALDGARFILDDLGVFELGGRCWRRYWRGLDTPTINVQASAASLFARLSPHALDERFIETADEAALTVLATQREDGSWPYASDPRGTFVDGFHTGFTLQGLAEYVALRGDNTIPGAPDSVRRGFAYFREHLLSAEGLPLDFADGDVTFDGQALAQALQTLVVCGGDSAALVAASSIWQAGLADLLRTHAARGARFPALRWSIGPAVLATAHLLSAGTS